MKPDDMIFKATKDRIIELGYCELTATNHANDAVRDYRENRKRSGRGSWIDCIISYNVALAQKADKK